jgi:hypothetical protein
LAHKRGSFHKINNDVMGQAERTAKRRKQPSRLKETKRICEGESGRLEPQRRTRRPSGLEEV